MQPFLIYRILKIFFTVFTPALTHFGFVAGLSYF